MRNAPRFLSPVINDWLYVSTAKESAFGADDTFHCFQSSQLQYTPFCDDFGPLSLADVFQFQDIVDRQHLHHPEKILVYCMPSHPREITNAAFLLGSYLIMTKSHSPDEAWLVFQFLSDRMEMYRDATFSRGGFRLTLLDCWSGLSRAKSLTWVDQVDLRGKQNTPPRPRSSMETPPVTFFVYNWKVDLNFHSEDSNG